MNLTPNPNPNPNPNVGFDSRLQVSDRAVLLQETKLAIADPEHIARRDRGLHPAADAAVNSNCSLFPATDFSGAEVNVGHDPGYNDFDIDRHYFARFHNSRIAWCIITLLDVSS